MPSDYASLQIRELPPVGGDTLWASAYEAYDRLSPAYKTFLEGLTATHIGQGFIDLAAKNDNAQMRENRGSPENVGQHLTAVHPVIRTNPVTGWKGLFVNRGFTKKIDGLTKSESDNLLEFLFDHISSACPSFFHSYLPLIPRCLPLTACPPLELELTAAEPRPASQVQMGGELAGYLGQPLDLPCVPVITLLQAEASH